MTTPDDGESTTQLLRSYFGKYRFDHGESVEFHLTHGDWIRLLRTNGFEVEDLLELQAPEEATRHPYYSDFSPEWSRKWPPEEIWVARRRA